MALTIRDIKVITTAPEGIDLVVVKVETSEPGLYGLGCATFTQRYKAVVTVLEEYLKPFLIGKDPQRIGDIWQTAMVSGYWRNGPVLNNAVSGIDMALWDIKGKISNQPLYQLFGGKMREAVPAYIHADGKNIEHAMELVQARLEAGWKNVRIQVGGYGGENPNMYQPENVLPGAYYDPEQYMKTMIETFHKARMQFGDEIGLCHDVHERLTPSQAMRFAREMEAFHLLFLEDPLPPEQVKWFDQLRAQTITPLAVGELFNNPNEWEGLVMNRRIDYLRLHFSQVGGITPILKAVALCDVFGVRTAWHGPGDVSPIAHAAGAHVSIAAPNLGIQEWSCSIKEHTYEVFPGMPVVKNGYIYLNDRPGLGLDIDEKEAAKYPCKDIAPQWTLARLPDGTPARP